MEGGTTVTKALLIPLILLVPPLSGAAETSGWSHIPEAAVEGKSPLPVWNELRAALVADTASVTKLSGLLLPKPLPREETAPDKVRDALLESLGGENNCGIVIEWLGADPVKDFDREWQSGGGQTRSSCRVGSTTVTRTVLASAADDAIFIHLHADQPGALSFRVRLSEDGARREDRRQLVMAPEKGPASHVWVIPFESDVEPDGQGITVRGEGEAMIVWKFSRDKSGAEDLARTWSRLAERHDPGHTPPDVSRIWRGVLEQHLKSAKDSP